MQGFAPEGSWQGTMPERSLLREPSAVHEASCLWMGDKRTESVVGPDFRPWGVQNVYVTGASLFPSSGSSGHKLSCCLLDGFISSICHCNGCLDCSDGQGIILIMIFCATLPSYASLAGVLSRSAGTFWSELYSPAACKQLQGT